MKNKHDQYADALFEEFFELVDTNNDQEISKVELFNHLWQLQYGHEPNEEEVDEADFENAQQQMFCYHDDCHDDF